MRPSGACFESGPNGHFLFTPSYSAYQRLTLLAVFNEFYRRLTVFDSTGRAWNVVEIRSPYTRSWWLLALVHTVFNPWVEVEILWAEPRPFRVDELKQAYLDALASDDDILTQFVERDELHARIVAAKSFHDLVATYRWMQTDHG